MSSAPKRKSRAKYVHRFSIDRATWGHGHNGGAYLGSGHRVETNNYQCCVGFYAESRGVPKALLRYAPYVDYLHERSPEEAEKCLVGGFTKFSDFSPFYERNDTAGGTLKAREKTLTRMFAEKGIKVTFRGKYPKKGKKA